jgi:hypothetical protein
MTAAPKNRPFKAAPPLPPQRPKAQKAQSPKYPAAHTPKYGRVFDFFLMIMRQPK